MTETELPYDDGGWLEPGKTVMVSLDPDECIIRPVNDGKWRCYRDHECTSRRWWQASSGNGGSETERGEEPSDG